MPKEKPKDASQEKPKDALKETAAPGTKRKFDEDQLLEVLVDLGPAKHGEWLEECKGRYGMTDSTFASLRRDLEKGGQVERVDNLWQIATPDGSSDGTTA